MGKLEGRVAFITGAARGQGRSHAVRMAREGAAVIAIDICRQIESIVYPLASPDDLEQTVREVEAVGGRIHAAHADVRDFDAVTAAFAAGTDALGPVDIVLANAGVACASDKINDAEWFDILDVNLTGAYNSVRVAIPGMIERGRGGSIVITSSTAGLSGICFNSPAGLAYSASKHGVVGLMRSYANFLAPHHIRVNTVHPTGVSTPMVLNDSIQSFVQSQPEVMRQLSNALPVDLLEPSDISDAIAWLVSDEGRYVTGVTLPVDAGFTNKK